jgi:hypothetical protein
MNRRVHVVIARTLRYSIQPSVDIDTAASELVELAGHERWLLAKARAVVTRRQGERPSPAGERSRELLDRALLLAADGHDGRDASRLLVG